MNFAVAVRRWRGAVWLIGVGLTSFSGVRVDVGLYDHLGSQEAVMSSMSLAEVKARLSAVVERVQTGETVQITKRGKPVAEISPIVPPRKKIDVDMLRRHAATLPHQEEDSGTFIRRMRDEARY